MLEPSVPEAFKVLIKEMQGLGLDVKLLNEEDKEFTLSELKSDNTETFNEVTKPRKEVEDVEIEFEGVTTEDTLEEGDDFDNIFDESALFDDLEDE